MSTQDLTDWQKKESDAPSTTAETFVSFPEEKKIPVVNAFKDGDWNWQRCRLGGGHYDSRTAWTSRSVFQDPRRWLEVAGGCMFIAAPSDRVGKTRKESLDATVRKSMRLHQFPGRWSETSTERKTCERGKFNGDESDRIATCVTDRVTVFLSPAKKGQYGRRPGGRRPLTTGESCKGLRSPTTYETPRIDLHAENGSRRRLGVEVRLVPAVRFEESGELTPASRRSARDMLMPSIKQRCGWLRKKRLRRQRVRCTNVPHRSRGNHCVPYFFRGKIPTVGEVSAKARRPFSKRSKRTTTANSFQSSTSTRLSLSAIAVNGPTLGSLTFSWTHQSSFQLYLTILVDYHIRPSI